MSRIAQGVMALKAWMFPPSFGWITIAPHGADISPSLTILAGLTFDNLSSWVVSSTQSYDLTCTVPYRSLLNTVMPGWLWSGMMDDAGIQNIPIEKFLHSYMWRYLIVVLEWKTAFLFRTRGLLQERTDCASVSSPTSEGMTLSKLNKHCQQLQEITTHLQIMTLCRPHRAFVL